MSERETVRIRTLAVQAFRNHEESTVSPGKRSTILVGPNAAGKSNLLEAVTLAVSGSSFRPFSWPDVVMEGHELARVRVDAERGARAVSVKLQVDSAGKRTFQVDGKRKKGPSDVVGTVPAVTFVPDDLQLAKGPAEARRKAVDTLGSQLSSAYAALRAEYTRVVRQRTALLRQRDTATELGAWDEALTTIGAAFFIHRARLATRIERVIVPFYETLSGGEEVRLRLAASWGGESVAPHEWAEMSRDEVERVITEAIGRKAHAERARGMTLIGPHRDDIVFTVEGRTARGFASQGQQRSLALAWKMAEAEVIGDVRGHTPVLLLDDVMSELDESRREALQRFVNGGPQALITTTNLAYFDAGGFDGAEIVEVHGVR